MKTEETCGAKLSTLRFDYEHSGIVCRGLLASDMPYSQG